MSNEQYLADRIALQDVMLKYAAGVDERDFDDFIFLSGLATPSFIVYRVYGHKSKSKIRSV